VKELFFWQRKLIQLLHDPPEKALLLGSRVPHRRSVEAIFQRLAGKPLGWTDCYPDWAATGADRPVLKQRKVSRGDRTLNVFFADKPTVTHPLTAAGIALRTVPGHTEWPDDHQKLMEDVFAQEEPNAEERGTEEEKSLIEWNDVKQVRETALWLWRAWRDELTKVQPDVRWDLLPADTRCPDHSVWDHTRLAAALAFVARRDPARHPWLFCATLGPAQRFLRAARTSRDLWLGSFLLSELGLAAMEPFVEHYGPDCILYPDLRGNPRFDAWLKGRHPSALPGDLPEPTTFAALIPNTFVAVVPGGGADYLESISNLAGDADRAWKKRWESLTGRVHKWLEEAVGTEQYGRRIGTMWTKQHECVLDFRWVAVKWDTPEKVKDFASLGARESLPAQEPRPEAAMAEDLKRIETRLSRFRPWVDPKTLSAYEVAREVFGKVNPGYLQNERGFDYPFTHMALKGVDALRKEARSPANLEERGEKCTVCETRGALPGFDGGPLDHLRGRVRRFWQDEKLDPEQRGADRLCSVCASRRFLVDAWGQDGTSEVENPARIWFGKDWKSERDADGKLRVPFPSTSTLALQDYLAFLATERKLEGPVREYVHAFDEAAKKTRWKRTTFSRCLPALALASASAHDTGLRFLMIDAQYLMPHALDMELRRWDNKPPVKQKIGAFQKAGERLRRAAAKRLAENQKMRRISRDSRIAVIAVDGDQLGALIGGDPKRIVVPWEDVLHPEIPRRLREEGGSEAFAWFRNSGWPDLLSQPRHVGPAIQALLSRSLAFFCHTLAPWVVEREFRGRLIYAGDDDILALAPADDALPIAARLQQLYSAPWVIDTRPGEDAWEWRRNDWAPKTTDMSTLRKTDRGRFLIPSIQKGKKVIDFPPETFEAHAADQSQRPIPGPEIPATSRIIPMLGRRQSVSAGIAVAHFKEPLGPLVDRAHRLLDEEAKEKMERRAAALSLSTRSGEKIQFSVKWDKDGGPPKAQEVIRDLTDGFRSGRLPGRLPYKLRELLPAALAPLPRTKEGRPDCEKDPQRQEEHRQLLEGLVAFSLESPNHPSGLVKHVVDLWDECLRAELEHQLAGTRDTGEHSLDGMLFCRALAQDRETV
jgi:CRISPR-associated protein Cmr2